jgi:hypothetical protein
VRGKFIRAVQQSMLRGALVAVAGFGLSLALGAGAFWLAGTSASAVAGSIAGAVPDSTPTELRSATIPTRTVVDEAVSVVLVNERALEASRLAEAEATTEIPLIAVPVAAATQAVVAAPAPAQASALAPGERVTASLSFYYCEPGVKGLHPGDGGGFCGVMRDGSVVYPGAAACDYAYLGQQFRIVGDPLDRVYRCADTGSAVHGMHRDIWFYNSDEGWDWQHVVGQSVVIEILP